MDISSSAATWFLPFVLPLCLYVAFTDLREMRITNQAVLVIAGLFVVLGFVALPFDVYLWRLGTMVAVLVIGIVLNAAGAMGAGDAKFIAVAAPYIAPSDWRLLMALFAAVLIAAFCAHRLAKISPLRQIAPHWASWDQGSKFPMGLALGFTLAAYLALGIAYGR